MHHLAVKSNLLDSSADTHLGFGINNVPICPKPRRLAPHLPEFLNPSGCSIHGTENGVRRNGILNMINEKKAEEQESSSGGIMGCYSGSPPGRTENPLVHDVHFVHQMGHYSVFPRDQSCRRN